MLICVVSCTVAALVTIYILPCLLTALAEHGFPITVDTLHLHDLALCILSCQRLIHRVSKPHISYKLRRRHFARLISLHLFSLSLSLSPSLSRCLYLSFSLSCYTLHSTPILEAFAVLALETTCSYDRSCNQGRIVPVIYASISEQSGGHRMPRYILRRVHRTSEQPLVLL